MGMCLSLCAVDSATINAVVADPPLIWKVVAPGDDEMYVKARRDAVPWWKRMFGRETGVVSKPVYVGATLFDGDLDKAWHGIHFLLTGTSWSGERPFNFLVLGGAQIGSIDVGYGPARAFTPAEVQELSEVLRSIDEKELRSRFDPAKMMKLNIYPEIWDRDADEDDTIGYCIEYYAELLSFLKKASEHSAGMILYLS
ncbi:MAG: YfbM family protein [Xanthomonadales bacterium]|nr:YfbM family protein [Xanthomonadales bacterium]